MADLERSARSTMIIWMGILLLGFATLPVGLIHVVLGIRRKEKKRIAYAVLIPVTVWIGIIALLEADRRFIDEETRKNGGETPDWVW